MKSLALHLLTILLLGSLQINIDKDSTLLRFGVSAQSIETTTIKVVNRRVIPTRAATSQTPSLLVPTRRERHSSATEAPHEVIIPTTETKASTNNRYINRRRQRVESSTLTSTTTTGTPAKSRRRVVSYARGMALQSNNNTENNKNTDHHIMVTVPPTKKLISTRQVRDAIDKIEAEVARSANHANTVRQNRSLQSETAVNHNHNDVHNNKQRRPLRRHRLQLKTENNNNNTNKNKNNFDDIHKRDSEDEKVQPIIPLVGNKPIARNSTKTLKTPRMIERLVAGHIQNAESRSKYEVSSVTINSTITNSSTTTKPTDVYFRRRQPMLSSSYRQSGSNVIAALTTTMIPTMQPNLYIDLESDRDDEALLDDAEDFDNWDNGILRLSAGSGKETSAKSKKHKEDSKKTLSDQVRDGKYGLIEQELFGREPKRPGVLSYAANKEVPIDNERNFGGLNEEDIWLAEDHLLVIKGGSLNEGDSGEPWAAIDDYEAPNRQIKIPTNPKIPPPFPVQLEENGPIQFIGNSKFTVVYPVANETASIYPTTANVNNTTTKGNGDNEKNIIARPGTSKDTTQDEPGYIYPAPYPPWLYHNQTFVNPFLTNARPITFPGLGPFPLGRNSTFVKLNGSEPFDEDDPSLYYPPAYTFVYKNNYTNAVSPGPLVPGIVLPPPPDQFSRLDNSEKSSSSSTDLPIRHRIYPTTSTSSTTTTTTTSTTSTTSTTTASPFGHVITKISQYTPKTIIITPTPPISSTKLPPTPPPTPPTTKATKIMEPIPIYPVKSLHPLRQNVLAFVPTTGLPTGNTLSKSNPIYYEYFEAKRQPGASNVIDDFLSSTSTTKLPPAAPKPIKIYAASKRPYKNNHSNRGNYLKPSNQRPYVPENVVYITPKPPLPPIFKQRPLDNFEREVQALRQTLRYYQNQQLRDNNIPRIPKAKTIYEYSFDATKSVQTTSQNIEETPSSFQPPAGFDEEPFKPMVTYSPPVDDENSFRAISYDKTDKVQQKSKSQNKYQSSTTLVPVQGENVEYVLPQSRSKQLRLSPKYLPEQYGPQGREEDFGNEFQTTQRTILTTQAPWISEPVVKMQFPQQQQQQQQMHRQPQHIQIPAPTAAGKNPRFTGYYYRPAGPPPSRQNNRFYDEPFHNSVRKIVNYRPHPVWSLENDTYVNYLPNRPPINPDAEYIDPYVITGYATAQRQGLTPPPLSHQSQFYVPPQRVQSPHRQNVQAGIPLHRDILVNYRQPLPAINPDAEYIAQPRNQPQPYYRPQSVYRLAPPPVDQSNIFYITPKYRRSNDMPADENESSLPSNNGK